MRSLTQTGFAIVAFTLGISFGLLAAQEKAPAKQQKPSGRTGHAAEHPKVPPASAAAAHVEKGYRVLVLLKNLTYPSAVELDSEGNLYVAEAGYAYGDPTVKPRIMQRRLGGAFEAVITDGLEGPVTDLLWHQGKLYISHRGKISTWTPGSGLSDLVTGLPSEGDHHNNQLAVGPDGKIYFGQGTVTNSGVVGLDNYKMGWLKKHPELHDASPRDLVLTETSFKTRNPFSGSEKNVAITSAFHPFGTTAQTAPGVTKANGTILRMNPDGTGLEVYAWGLRNPYGLVWGLDKKLYATENGFDIRGSRPIADDREDLYWIKEGAWYGWPDYASGIPVTDPRFHPKGGPVPQFLMKNHPPVEKPLLTFPKHAAVTQLDVSRSKQFGFEGQLFVAFFGHMTPMTGKPPADHGGHRVLRIDPATGKMEKFFGRKEHGHHGGSTYGEAVKDATQPAQEKKKKAVKDDEHHHAGAAQKERAGHGHHHEGGATPGPRRLVDVRFSPAGDALYIVDFGAMFVDDKGPHPVPGTGVIWQITRDDKAIITP